MNWTCRLVALILAMTVAAVPIAFGVADDKARPAVTAGPGDGAAQAPGETSLVAVVPESFPPDHQVDKSGRPAGFAIEVMDAVAARAGFTVRYRIEKDWPAVQAAIRRGDADAIPNMGITEERLEDFIYTRPYETMNVSLFVLKSSDDILGASRLQGQVAGTVKGNVAVSLLAMADGVEVVVFDTLSKALFALIDGTVSALAYPEPIVWALAKELKLDGRIKTTGPPLATVERAMAVGKDNLELRARLDAALAAYMETLAFRETFRKWRLGPTSFWTLERFVALSGAILAALLILVGYRLARSRRVAAAVQTWRHGGLLDPGVRARLVVFCLVLPLAAFAVFAATLATLYGAAFNQQRDRLQEMAGAQARLIDAIAEFDVAHNLDFPGGSAAATLGKITDALRRHKGAGEFTLARRRADKIEFFVRQHAPSPYALTAIPFNSDRARPMRRALLGQSGTMVGRDYDNVMVLAAYESIGALGLGLVVKIDLADIRAPYVRAGLIAALVTAVIAGAGTAFTFGLFNAVAASIKGIGERFRTLLEAHTDLVCRYAPDGTLLFVNGAYGRFFGRSPRSFLGASIFGLMPADRQANVKDLLKSLKPDARSFSVEYQARDGHGKTRWLQWTHTALFGDDGGIAELIGIGRDMTQRRSTEEAVLKSNRAFKTLSACNMALVRINSEEELFVTLCRTIVDVGGYRMAWIGLKRPDEAKTVEPAAHAGHSEGYVESLRVSWADNDRGRGPVGTTIRTGNPVVIQDAVNDPGFAPWLAEAKQRGYRSVAAFPLFVEGEVIGALNVYAGEVDAFDAQETALLTELAQDMSFGLATLRQRERRRQAEEAMRISAARLSGAIQSMQEGFALFDAEDRLVAFNDTYRRINPYADEALEKRATFEETLRKNIDKGVIPEAAARAEEFLRERLEQHRNPGGTIVRRFKDGRTFMLREARTPEGGIALSLADVTDLRRKEDALTESEARFRAVLDTSPAAVVLKDRQGRYLLANETFRAWTNIKDRDLAGLNISDLFSMPDAEDIAATDEKVFASGKADVFEKNRMFADGIARDVIVHKCPIVSASGEVAAISVTVTDISEIKNAEKKARQSDLRLRAAIESMQEGFALYDADDRLVAINEVYRNMSPDAATHLAKNSRFEDVLRGNVASGWIADAAGRDEAFIQERLEQHRHPTGPVIRRVGNGQWFLIKETRTPDGGTALTFTNITALKRVEQRLLESERRFQDFADSTSDWFWELDEDLRFSYFSERHGDLAVFPAVRMMGQRPWEIPDTKPVSEGGWRRHRDILEARQPFRDFETRTARKDKTEFYVSVSGKPVFDEAGDFMGYRGTATDITGRKKAERTLVKLSRAVEQSPAAIIIADADGTIEYVNARFTALTGYAAIEAIGKNPRMLQSGETPREVYEELWATIKAGREWRGVFRNRRKDGTVYMAGTSITPILGADGRIVNLIAAQQDITQRLEAEKQMRQAEKIQALGGIAGGIAHEFNNMLLPILSLSDMARKSLPADSRNRLRLDKVIEAAKRAQALVSRILMFSRQEEPVMAPIDICECVRHSLGLIQSTLPATVKIVEKLSPDTGTVVADKTQIETVIMNLAVNAADAMEGKVGKISFTLTPEDIGPDEARAVNGLRAGRFAKFTVADTGCGMDEQTLSRAMEPFFTTKPVGKGTGLGLAMVNGIVGKCGGAIGISSAPGLGTTVEIYLPIAAAGPESNHK